MVSWSPDQPSRSTGGPTAVEAVGGPTPFLLFRWCGAAVLAWYPTLAFDT